MYNAFKLIKKYFSKFNSCKNEIERERKERKKRERRERKKRERRKRERERKKTDRERVMISENGSSLHFQPYTTIYI
jgi:hypothetical protein